MRRILVFLALLLVITGSAQAETAAVGDKLREWRTGVWLLGDGSYAIYTDAHYFVVSVSGDSARTNLYCGASRIRFTDKGMVREQTLRVRQTPGGPLKWFKNPEEISDSGLAPLEYDPTLFKPGTCNIVGGVIYDSVTEVTDDYILLSTCNGDREKIYSDGRSAYLPAGGGEYWSVRIEVFR
jgi:hypothetical protein